MNPIKIVSSINALIADSGVETNSISDGFHTFGELYEHRIELFIALCRVYSERVMTIAWRSKIHSDGSSFDGWFVLGLDYGKDQITYHLPISRWDDCSFAETMDRAPGFDGHTSRGVLDRLKRLI